MAQDATSFTLAVPIELSALAKKTIATCWPRATVAEISDPLASMHEPQVAGILELKEHYLFRLRVDRRTLAPLSGVLDCLHLLDIGEQAHIQILATPAPPDWWQSAAIGYESYREGHMPKRLRLDAAGIACGVLKGTAGVVFEAINIAQELAGVEPEKYELDGIDKARTLRDGPTGTQTPAKLREDAFEVTIRVVVETHAQNAPSVLHAIAYAFRELDGDNALMMHTCNPARTLRLMQERHQPIKPNHDYLGVGELARLMQLPTLPLQEQYHLYTVQHRETDLPNNVTSKGLQIGTHTYHGQENPVYLPTKDFDELCLPHVIIGGMGCGKTKGFGANLAVQAVRHGMGAVIIDPAKGELGDEVEAVLPPEKIVRVRLGQTPICLDWREALHGERGRNRLANELISFCEAASDEAGAQTVRYLRSAAKAVPNGTLNEVVRLLLEDNYREELLPSMRAQEKMVWEQFGQLSEARRAQIGLPVLNRLDVIMGDDYLAECMEAEEGLDLVKLLDEPKAIILDIPKGQLGAEAVDVLASLVATKLDLAMVMRQSQHPVFIIQDEPHQYLRSARTWRAAAVESRKWRFAYVWMFHAWEQLPKDVAAIIQAAGPHYHLYTSSKATYRALAEEIKPFDVEEAMATPRHWAINVIRAGGRTVEPFMAKMSPPPSMKQPEKAGK